MSWRDVKTGVPEGAWIRKDLRAKVVWLKAKYGRRTPVSGHTHTRSAATVNAIRNLYLHPGTIPADREAAAARLRAMGVPLPGEEPTTDTELERRDLGQVAAEFRWEIRAQMGDVNRLRALLRAIEDLAVQQGVTEDEVVTQLCAAVRR